MDYRRRAWLSVTRRKGKSLLLLAILLVLGSVIGGAAAVRIASGNVHRRTRSLLSTAVTIGFDQEALHAFQQENPGAEIQFGGPDAEQLEAIGSSPYVKYFQYSSSMPVQSEMMDKYIPAYLQEGQAEKAEKKIGEERISFSLSGVSHSRMVDFEEGKSRLLSGRVFSEEEISSGCAAVLISRNLAEQNQIRLGDSLVLQAFIFDLTKQLTEEETEFPVLQTLETSAQVIGIYESTPRSERSDARGGTLSDPWGEAYQDQTLSNTLITPLGFARAFKTRWMHAFAQAYPNRSADLAEDLYQAVFILKDPLHLEPFIRESQPLLPPYNRFVSSLDNYRLLSGPLEQAEKLSVYALIAASLAGAVIVGLVVVLFLRDRKHELGIYLSLGERRIHIIRQVLLETLIIAVLGIALSVFTGQILAASLTNTLVQSEFEKAGLNADKEWHEYEKGIAGIYLSDNFSMQNLQEAYGIELTAGYIAVFGALSLGVISLSTLAPILYILRLRPRKILM